MTLPRIANRDDWLAARRELLAKEKELTRRSDALNIERRNLPMVEVAKPYEFDGPSGTVHLADLFGGRTQLIVYHFMFHPEWEEGCPSCSAGIDELSPGFFEHLHTRDTTYAMVSRAPLNKLERWKKTKGWDIPWYSSGNTDFNYDFGVTIDASRGFDRYNFRSLDEYAAMGQESLSPALRHAWSELLPPDGWEGVPHLLPLRPRAGVNRRVLLLLGPHRPGPSGGVGGAEGSQLIRPVGHAGLRLVADRHPRGCADQLIFPIDRSQAVVLRRPSSRLLGS